MLGDMLVLDTSDLTWANGTGVLTGPKPPPRAAHGLAAAGGSLFVFGGAHNELGQCRRPAEGRWASWRR
jgi:hypothetical protein